MCDVLLKGAWAKLYSDVRLRTYFIAFFSNPEISGIGIMSFWSTFLEEIDVPC
jgi:hypothetical protein